jgi:hypothetical protein
VHPAVGISGSKRCYAVVVRQQQKVGIGLIGELRPDLALARTSLPAAE